MFMWGELNCNTDSLILPYILIVNCMTILCVFNLKKKVKVVGGCVFIVGTFREGYMCEFCEFLMSDELFYMYLTETTA